MLNNRSMPPGEIVPEIPYPWLIEAILEHILIIRLSLGIIVQRNANTKE